MASFDKYSNYREDTSFSSVVFGAEKPVLEVELNELQQILNTKFSRFLKGFRSGVIPLSSDSITFSTSSLTLTVKDCIILDGSGLTAYISSASVVMSTTNRRAYFALQEVDVDSNSELKSYGNTSGAVVTNLIIDNRLSVETTRRKAVTYTLMSSQNVPTNTDTIKYVLVGSYISSVFTPVKWGLENPEFTGSVSMGRKGGSTVGTNSVAFGLDNIASGDSSFAQGEGCTASGMRSFASGYNSKATGGYSQAFGNACEASATGAIATGASCKATSYQAVSMGGSNTASGENSFASGYNNTALKNQFATGHYNDTTIALANDLSGAGTGTAFVIGNGTSSAKSNAFRVQSDGVTYAKGAYNATGADYAEYLEWADGNPDNEDRRGYFVTFDEDKPDMIRKANSSDVYILGVVSGNPCIIGNSDECWLGKNLFDEFNTPIYEFVEEEFEYEDPETHKIIKKVVKVKQQKVSPDYDPSIEYIHRRDRQEWSAVGFIGVLPVRDNGNCQVGGYCTWGEDGIAVPTEPSRFNYRVIERVNDNIVKIVLK